MHIYGDNYRLLVAEGLVILINSQLDMWKISFVKFSRRTFYKKLIFRNVSDKNLNNMPRSQLLNKQIKNPKSTQTKL